MTKKIVRQVKYNPPKVNFDALEEELHTQLVSPDHEATSTLRNWWGEDKTGEDDDNELDSISAKYEEEELDEYAQWAKESAEKAEAAKAGK